jgi:hypothetical protein
MKPSRFKFTRSSAVLRLQRRLEEQTFPRVQMALIVMLTGAIGVLVSFLFLRWGMDSMAVRYPLAVAFAYVFFLFLLWLWLRTKAEDYLDLPDLSGGLPIRGSEEAPISIRSGDGEFGGSGASGSFDGPASSSSADGLTTESSIADTVGSAVDADELAIPILGVLLAVGLAVASLYVIYIAPVLFAELLVDGALSYALYRHLRRNDSHHWLTTALRRSVIPFAATAVFLAILGVAMSAYAPGARSVGEVIRHSASR